MQSDFTDPELDLLINGLSDDVAFVWVLVHLRLRSNPPAASAPPSADDVHAAFEVLEKLSHARLLKIGHYGVHRRRSVGTCRAGETRRGCTGRGETTGHRSLYGVRLGVVLLGSEHPRRRRRSSCRASSKGHHLTPAQGHATNGATLRSGTPSRPPRCAPARTQDAGRSHRRADSLPALADDLDWTISALYSLVWAAAESVGNGAPRRVAADRLVRVFFNGFGPQSTAGHTDDDHPHGARYRSTHVIGVKLEEALGVKVDVGTPASVGAAAGRGPGRRIGIAYGLVVGLSQVVTANRRSSSSGSVKIGMSVPSQTTRVVSSAISTRLRWWW